jgi:hypothetical protein
MMYVRMHTNNNGVPTTTGILADIEVTPGYPHNNTGE